MPKENKLVELDKNMQSQQSAEKIADWYSIDDKPFVLDGLYWRRKGAPLRRIPLKCKISEGVDYLAWNTAGVMLRFKSDTSSITIDAKVSHTGMMPHMPPVASKGFDVYIGSTKAKTYAASSIFDAILEEYNVEIYKNENDGKIREFTIHFPLYAGVEKFRIGLSHGAKVLPPTPWQDERPVVVYGTSIQQGGCANRAGMCHTNIMSRMLNRRFINLGFSGNGKGEPQMAELIASIKNPAMFILDYDANAQVDGLRKTLSIFIDILRASHPETPILLVSRLPYAYEFRDGMTFCQDREDFTEIHTSELKKRRENGDKNIHFLDGFMLYGANPAECTVDGVHATDYGFMQIAQHMAPVIERILTSGDQK